MIAEVNCHTKSLLWAAGIPQASVTTPRSIKRAFLMDNNGWIKVFRKIIDNEIWKDRPFSKGQAWIDLIFLANYKDTDFCKRGELKTTQKYLSERWGWNRLTVRHLLIQQLKHQVNIKTDNKHTYITINNYDKYQSNYATNEHQNIQQINTTKEERSKKKEITPSIISPLTEQDLLETAERYGVPIAFVRYQKEALDNYVASSGKRYKDLKAALRNFVLRDIRKIKERGQENGRKYSYTKIS